MTTKPTVFAPTFSSLFLVRCLSFNTSNVWKSKTLKLMLAFGFGDLGWTNKVIVRIDACGNIPLDMYGQKSVVKDVRNEL